MASRIRRASLEAVERIVKDVTVTQAEATRDRRLSLTMMNCIWARNTDVETTEPVQGHLICKYIKSVFNEHSAGVFLCNVKVKSPHSFVLFFKGEKEKLTFDVVVCFLVGNRHGSSSSSCSTSSGLN